MRVQIALCNVALCLGLAPIVMAQDAVKVDPKHYTVMSENDKGRIVNVHYGPGEKKQDITAKAGDSQYEDAVTHLPENTGDNGMDIILVELKGHSGKAKSGMKSEMK